MSAAPYVKTLHPVGHASAKGPQKEILDLALKQVGFIPNMYANMANAPAVLSTYLHGYGLFRSESGLTPAEQEVVFLAVSQVNGCDYCMAAHSMIADKMSGVPREVLQAIRDHQPIPDAKLAALHATTTELVRSHGLPSAETVKAFLDAGYQERDLLYIVLAIAVKTLSNFTNHAFATQVDERFAAYKVA
ncbi:MAG: alkylhydroperoxidase [Burkholderiales bacterium RIFCSPHIGHO2_12_FULL_61_11]|nr:MAG: alkylhydroperoxidase [Burkholderiales bacterium RIFCSPHIGHO2_12_FULL_61_11]